jgi:predicted amino acid racemase
MDTPRLEVDLHKIRHNAKAIIGMCRQKGIEVVGVPKGASGIPQVAKAMLDGGVRSLADARIRNIDKLRKSGLGSDIMMLRLPRISSAAEVVQKTEASLNSELSIIRSLVKESQKAGKPHGIIYMVDVGDLREGVLYTRAMGAVAHILAIKGINFLGIGTNVGCYGGVIPTEKNMGLLVEIARNIKNRYAVEFPVISVGGTNCLTLIRSGKMPSEVNQVRIGEGILLGRDSSQDAILEDTFQDAFVLAAEIVELKQKPSVPIGAVGRDAFGNLPFFANRGVRKRALISLGKQDVLLSGLIPVDRHIKILGGSSDYFILDISDSERQYSIGDEVRFNLKYPGLLSVTTSPYVSVVCI